MAAAKRTLSPDQTGEVFRPDDPSAASRAARRGELRRLAQGLYTWNLEEPAEQLVRRRWLDVAAIYFPGAVIVDRSAVLGAPAKDGSLFLDAGPSYKTNRAVKLPGLTLRARGDAGPIEGDMPFGELHRSGQARTALDNMRTSRARSGVARTLSRAELEQWLDRIASARGEDELLHIRDEARSIAPTLGLVSEQKKLDELIGALLGTREAPLESEAGKARREGAPFDAARLELFALLHEALSGHIDADRPEPGDPRRVFAFFEAYFSNFIEGTEFEVDEAERIVFEGVVPEERSEDAHDILGTFQVVTDPTMRGRVPKDADDLIEIAVELNRRILKSRPGANPGVFKTKPNRAGGTTFVAPDLVEGTLREGWRLYETLAAGFARAVFTMLLVTEVHPFADGNGRVARALMNQELTARRECRVVIPLSYRPDYLGALRAMSRQRAPQPLIRMVDRAQRWAFLVDWADMDTALPRLERSNALVPSDRAEEEGLRLLDPK